jgi:uncharacterized protein (DUF1501 family)
MLGIALAGAASGLPKVLRAATAGDRSVVCIYLTGGSDGNSLVAPLEGAVYHTYRQLRGKLAFRVEDLLRVRGVVNPGEYGFHPALTDLRDLFSRGVLGVVANVGAPRSSSAALHNYNSMTFLPGGFMTPNFAAAQAGINAANSDGFLGSSRGISMVPLDGGRSMAHNREEFSRAAANLKLNTVFPDTPLGRGLRDVAAYIQSGIARRAVYTVPMSGFDMHSDQPQREQPLLRELGSAMAAFYAATEEMGVSRHVVTYTDSEFGRSITPNATNGTEDGWGNHHLVMGATALGGDIHGKFPDMTASARDANGGWVPTTSHDQYVSMI